MTYPVLEERPLPPIQRRAFRAAWRDPGTLPAQAAGAVYVFEYDGRYRDPFARRVNGSEAHVVDATAVSLVEVRDRSISVRRAMPSARLGVDLLLTVSFRCVVTSPAAVAQAGLTDLEAMLAAHVAADRELATLGRFVAPERAGDARLRAEAQLRAHCTVNPPELVGVECAVAAVDVRADTQGRPEITRTDLSAVSAAWPELSLHEQAESRLSAMLGGRPTGRAHVAEPSRPDRDRDDND